MKGWCVMAMLVWILGWICLGWAGLMSLAKVLGMEFFI